MAKIMASYKIFPADVNVDLNKLRQAIEKALPENVKLHSYNVEPVAFGLNVLITHVTLPENLSGILNEVEQSLEKIPEISQIQTLTVKRTR